MAQKLARAGALASLLALAVAGLSAGATSRGQCSVEKLGASSVRVVQLRATGIACVQARKVAGRIASDLAHGRSVAVTGSVGFGMTQQTCTGCKTTTTVTISYPHGSLAISLRGGSGSNTSPAMPTIPSFGSSGGGSVI
jgi:hypothetical protein